ncbi:MAG: type II toxin-antitoxin system RelE/ParE family toxin [Desulfobacter sp.]|jgi:plasmid stabilization system protein ParE|nr:type II toxin-antitoxin system RelE/ParE family toxin [Desulfobacter sp.]
MNLVYTNQAEADLKNAFAWYEEKRKGLGYEFLNCVEAALQNIIAMPEMYQKRYGEVHGCPIRRFPFSVFYIILNSEIVVHSFFDDRQDPQKRP